MDKNLFQELESNLNEAVSVARGTSAPRSIYVVMSPAAIKSIRREPGYVSGRVRPDVSAKSRYRQGLGTGKAQARHRGGQLFAADQGGSRVCSPGALSVAELESVLSMPTVIVQSGVRPEFILPSANVPLKPNS